MDDRSSAAIRGPLYDTLTVTLPAFVGPDGSLDVNKLRQAVGMSKEGVYKWLRSNKLTPEAAKKVVGVAGSPDNVMQLAGRKVAEPSDFSQFVFA